MTEGEFKVRCGRESVKEVTEALIEHFRAIGWHDAVRIVEASIIDEPIDEERIIDEAESAGWERASIAALAAIRAYNTNSVELRGKIADAVEDALA